MPSKKKETIDIILKAHDKASAVFRTFTRQLKRAEKAIFNFKTALISILGGYTFTKLFESMMSTTDAFQKYQLSLETLIGSHEKAARAWQEMLAFARETPYTINDVMESYKMLLAFGLEPSVEMMRILGDTAAVVGRDALPRIAYALGQIKTAGQVRMQDLMQLQNAGINTAEALKEVFKTSDLEKINAALKRNVISIQDVIDAFLQYMQSRFGGQMQRAMETLGGQLEILRSNWQEFQDLIGRSGVYRVFTNFLREANKELERLRESGDLKEWARGVSDALVASFETAIRSVELFVEALIKADLYLNKLRITLYKPEGGLNRFSRDVEDLYYNIMKWAEKPVPGEWLDKWLERQHKQYQELGKLGKVVASEAQRAIENDVRLLDETEKGFNEVLNLLQKARKDAQDAAQDVPKGISESISKSSEKVKKDLSGIATGGKDATKALNKLKAEAARIYEETRTPMEKYEAEIAKLQMLLRLGYIDTETYYRALEVYWERNQQALEHLRSIAQEIYEQTRTPLEQYEEKLNLLDDLLDLGLIDLETYSRAVEMYWQNYGLGAESAVEKTKTAFSYMEQIAIQAARNMESAFADFLFSSLKGDFGSFREWFQSFMDSILRIWSNILAEMIMKAFASWAAQSGISWLSSIGTAILGGAPQTRAMGGVFEGEFYPIAQFSTGGIVDRPVLGLVGEGRYKEAVVPLPDGRTIPAIVKDQEPPINIRVESLIEEKNVRVLSQAITRQENKIETLVRTIRAEQSNIWTRLHQSITKEQREIWNRLNQTSTVRELELSRQENTKIINQLLQAPGASPPISMPGRETPQIHVKLENATGIPMEAQQGQVYFDGERYIVGVILKNIESHGPLYHALVRGGR